MGGICQTACALRAAYRRRAVGEVRSYGNHRIYAVADVCRKVLHRFRVYDCRADQWKGTR